ncbi:hypothetical protein CPC08DRAFT_767541 [Agrocybe pediades]|nr:hypothetical protein CPC08DRAFT_767541 [Agrocybe pediades]
MLELLLNNGAKVDEVPDNDLSTAYKGLNALQVAEKENQKQAVTYLTTQQFPTRNKFETKNIGECGFPQTEKIYSPIAPLLSKSDKQRLKNAARFAASTQAKGLSPTDYVDDDEDDSDSDYDSDD